MFIDPHPHSRHGSVVGDGHCVALVRHLRGANAPRTSQWRPGAEVLGNLEIGPGTAIATFDADGRYGNHVDGRSHAGIYIEQVESGIRVIDQWLGRVAQTRVIRDKHGEGPAVDDASRYRVIEA